jgi:hypothetical protein
MLPFTKFDSILPDPTAFACLANFAETVKSPLGIFGLMLLGLISLARLYFKNAGPRITVPIFLCMFAGVAIYGVYRAITPHAENNTPNPSTPSPSPVPNASPVPAAIPFPRKDALTSIKARAKHTPEVGSYDVEAQHGASLGSLEVQMRTLFWLPARVLPWFLEEFLIRNKGQLRPTLRPRDPNQRKDHRLYPQGTNTRMSENRSKVASDHGWHDC